jgi:hypothetical protein
MVGGRNAKKVWYDGVVYDSLAKVGKALGVGGAGTVTNYIKAKMTPDYKPIFYYKEETFDSDFIDSYLECGKVIRHKVDNLMHLEGELEDVYVKYKSGK